jgi:hypothetical protein
MKKAAREKFNLLKTMIKSDTWVFELADDTTTAIALIKICSSQTFYAIVPLLVQL